MATTQNNPENLESPAGLIFLPAEDHEHTLFHVIDLRETEEMPEIDFTPVTNYPEREFGDHYAKIAMGRDYARGLTPDQQMALYEQLQEAKTDYGRSGELLSPALSHIQGSVAVASLVEL